MRRFFVMLLATAFVLWPEVALGAPGLWVIHCFME